VTLPATWADAVEAEVLAYARDWIMAACKPGGIFHADAEAEYGCPLMKVYALQHPFGADEIVYFAERGSVQADMALREIIAERTDRNEPLGAVLGAYNIRILNPTRPRRSGPPRAVNFVRDIGIAELVATLMRRFGLRASRNTASKAPSACSVAAQVLTEAGIGVVLTPKGVERIWQRYLPVFAGTRLAVGTRFAGGLPAGWPGLFG
jgi:hypothetical protein